MFITLLAGIVFVVMRWNRSPKAALLALIGLVLLLLHSVVFKVIHAIASETIMRSGSIRSSANYFFVLGLINYLAMAFAFAFLLTAVFVRREPARQTAI